jgi:anti-sigma B factor antagonist
MINVERKDKIDIVTFNTSRINALITDELRVEIGRLFDASNSKVIIDLTGVDYIDSSGFGCFLSVLKSSREKYGVLKFANPEPRIIKLFNSLYLHSVFQIYEDIDTCISSFR